MEKRSVGKFSPRAVRQPGPAQLVVAVPLPAASGRSDNVALCWAVERGTGRPCLSWGLCGWCPLSGEETDRQCLSKNEYL